MNGLRGFLGTRNSSANASSKSLSADGEGDETRELNDAMNSAMHVIKEDNVALAMQGLERGKSSFHILGRGIVTFLQAIMGSEKDAMHDAHIRLLAAETAGNDNKRRAEREPQRYYQSAIYPPGTEHALCAAESMIMNAGVAVLNENVYEALKGFYKMRKAYQTLDAIANAENDYLERAQSAKHRSSTTLDQNQTTESGGSVQRNGRSLAGGTDEEDDDEEFFDATDDQINPVQLSSKLSDTGIKPAATPLSSHSTEESSIEALISHPIDLFVHTGTALHFGIILLMLSMIPPAFSRLLSLIGFRGDREKGLAMLWRASAVRRNINGCVAALVLLGYYNGLVSFLDILPPETYPKTRCDRLLEEMRQEYPKSRFWYLQTARTRAATKDLEGSVQMLEEVEQQPCGFRQVEALQWFEKSLNLMALHSYQKTADSFQICVKLNKWSHGLYHYITACAHVELYRHHTASEKNRFARSIPGLVSDPSQAEGHKKKALYHLLERVPNHMGKKKLIGRQLPFDTFVLRKLAKWKERAESLGCDLIDAVGVSPYEEQLFFWGGYARQRPEQLHQSLAALSWSDGGRGDLLSNESMIASPPGWEQEAADEVGLLALLRAHIYRQLRRTELTRSVLAENPPMASGLDASTFRGGNKDNWVAPIARYELAVVAWIEAGGTTGAEAHTQDMTVLQARSYDHDKLQECLDLLEVAGSWESFDLDARFGIKITTGKDTVSRVMRK